MTRSPRVPSSSTSGRCRGRTSVASSPTWHHRRCSTTSPTTQSPRQVAGRVPRSRRRCPTCESGRPRRWRRPPPPSTQPRRRSSTPAPGWPTGSSTCGPRPPAACLLTAARGRVWRRTVRRTVRGSPAGSGWSPSWRPGSPGASCLAVVGSSGSGKSSVVHAGLLAGLADGLLPGSSGVGPPHPPPGPAPGRRARTGRARRPPTRRRGDPRAAGPRRRPGRPGADGRTVLVIDQLEEVWTACDDEGERVGFLDALAGLVADAASPVVLVLVVRADYLDRLADQPALAAAVGDNTVLVGTPTADDVRRAVSNPATRAGLVLDEGLLDAIVTDAGAEPGLLPLLSTSLRRLWEERKGNRLTLATYVASGGLRGGDRPPGRVRVRATGRRRAAGRPGPAAAVDRPRGGRCRHPSPRARAELAALPRDPARLVERLAAARLLTVSDEHVEVAHEALFREWPRLRGWLDDDRAGREVERRLAVATTEWRQEDRDPALLWRGTRLDAGLEVARPAAPGGHRRRARLPRRRSRRRRGGAPRRPSGRTVGSASCWSAALALILVATVAGGFALRSREPGGGGGDRRPSEPPSRRTPAGSPPRRSPWNRPTSPCSPPWRPPASSRARRPTARC